MSLTHSSLLAIKNWGKSRAAHLCYLIHKSDTSYSQFGLMHNTIINSHKQMNKVTNTVEHEIILFLLSKVQTKNGVTSDKERT
jgi:hypothetical protein